MTKEFFLLMIFAVALLFICWMLAEYWIGIRNGSMHEQTGKLRAGSRTAFALLHFWKRVDHARDIPKDTLKKEMQMTEMEIPGKEERKGKA